MSVTSTTATLASQVTSASPQLQTVKKPVRRVQRNPGPWLGLLLVLSMSFPALII